MATETYLTLGSTLIEIENLDRLEIEQKINEHGKLYLSGIVKEAKGDDYITVKGELTSVEVGYFSEAGGEGEYTTLFKGFTTKPHTTKVNGRTYIEIEAKTDSCLMDSKKIRKSYQDKTVMYRNICEEVLGNYESGDFIYALENDCVTDRFILQYDETDWEFLKRLGSYNNFALLPEMTLGAPKIFIGFPKGNTIGKIEKFNHEVSGEPFEYKILNENVHNTRDINELDLVEIDIETFENYDVGDMALYFNGETGDNFELYIREKTIRMYNGVLSYRYTFGTKNTFYGDRIFNENIIGLALKGKVLDRVQDTVKVHLFEIDDEGRSSNHYFKYSTPYTADGHSGWYVMPELDDVVFIKSIDKDENNSVADGGIRMSGEGKISDPNIKYLRTKDGRELKLAPDELVITCSNWSDKETGEEEKIFIQMKAGEGITIMSTKDINVHAEGDLTLTADKKIAIEATEEIDIKCGTSGIKLDSSGIDIEAPTVKVN